MAAPQVEGYSSSSSNHNTRMASEAEKLCVALRRPRVCCSVGAEPARLRAQIPERVRDPFQQLVCPVHGGWIAESRMQCWMLGNGQRPRWSEEMLRMSIHLAFEEAWLYPEILVLSGAKASHSSRLVLLEDAWLRHRGRCEWEETFNVKKQNKQTKTTYTCNVESSVLY